MSSRISYKTQSQIDAYTAAGWQIQTRCPGGRRARDYDAVRIRSTRYAASQRHPSETWAVRPKTHPVPFRSTNGQALAPEDAHWTFDDFLEAAGRIERLFLYPAHPVTISAAEIADYARFARELGLDGTADQLTARAVQLRVGGGGK